MFCAPNSGFFALTPLWGVWLGCKIMEHVQACSNVQHILVDVVLFTMTCVFTDKGIRREKCSALSFVLNL